jgi:hypothetical protein
MLNKANVSSSSEKNTIFTPSADTLAKLTELMKPSTNEKSDDHTPSVKPTVFSSTNIKYGDTPGAGCKDLPNNEIYDGDVPYGCDYGKSTYNCYQDPSEKPLVYDDLIYLYYVAVNCQKSCYGAHVPLANDVRAKDMKTALNWGYTVGTPGTTSYKFVMDSPYCQGLTAGGIVGVVIGVLAAVLICVGCLFYHFKKKRESSMEAPLY